MTKQELRNQIKQIMSSNAASFQMFSSQICNLITEFSEYKKAKNILAYMPLNDEVDLKPVIKAALEEGKTVYLPKVDPLSPQMEFYKINAVHETSKGAFGIDEPEAGIPFNLHSNTETLVLVPGRSFTSKGARLGRGKAYYDTYFSFLSHKVTMAGVCFGCQLVQELPVEKHDITMDWIITENGTIDCNS